MNERACKRCGQLTWSSRSPYCLEHRPPPEVRARWAAKTRERRGYGAIHKHLRERYRLLIGEGSVVLCARCRKRLLPGEPFDLGHVDRDRTRYAGPEHRRCNRVAGAKSGAAVTNARRRACEPEYVRSWSRVWSWPIPLDVYVDPEIVRAYLEEGATRDRHPELRPSTVRSHP
jgi:hypothetical protein